MTFMIDVVFVLVGVFTMITILVELGSVAFFAKECGRSVGGLVNGLRETESSVPDSRGMQILEAS